MIVEELRRLLHWEERHRRLAARLILLLATTIVLDLAGTVATFFLERHAKDTDVHGLFDAFFYTTVQLLSVSSSLKNPITTGGRIVDIGLEIWAVIAVTGSAGAVASFFQTGDS